MKYSKLLVINLIAGYVMSGITTLAAATHDFFDNNILNEVMKINVTAEIEALIFFGIVGFLYFLMFNLFYLPIHIIKMFSVVKDNINKKYVDTKQSIYTRELPKYNSAIAGEILDFKTTFKEEYIAGVIELISKGYIIEKEHTLIVDKTKSTENLLKNEKYILETCENINANLYLMSNYNFYKELQEDMYDLGLYKRNTFLKGLINKIMYYAKKYKIYTFYAIFTILIIILVSLFENFFVNLILIILLYITIITFIRKNKLTKNGELEKEKMGKLKLFLEKETNFKEKGESEREQWGRYSAFAVAFGLNEEMKEEIKKKFMKTN